MNLNFHHLLCWYYGLIFHLNLTFRRCAGTQFCISKWLIRFFFSSGSRNLVSILLLFATVYSSFSQVIYYDTSDSTDWQSIAVMTQSTREIRDSLQMAGYSAKKFIIHEIAGKTWMTIDGRFDVFEWHNDHWVNLYKGTYHGYNFLSQKFTIDGKLFSYRGYGYWQSHGEIIEFLPEQGGWEIVSESADLPVGLGYVRDSVFHIISDKCIEVDVRKGKVKSVPCLFQVPELILEWQEYNFRDYLLLGGNMNPLIDKQNGDVYLSSRSPFKSLLHDWTLTDALIHLKDNDITIVFADNDTVRYNANNELQYYMKQSEEEEQTSFWLWAPLIVLIIATVIFLLYRYYPRRQHSDAQILSAFKGYEGKLLDSDTFDAILGIEDIIVYETRKHKRATLIKEINMVSASLYGKTLIERERNPNDKRFFLYRVKEL